MNRILSAQILWFATIGVSAATSPTITRASASARRKGGHTTLQLVRIGADRDHTFYKVQPAQFLSVSL